MAHCLRVLPLMCTARYPWMVAVLLPLASALLGQEAYVMKQLPAERVIVARGGYFPKMLLRADGELLCTFKNGSPHAGKTGRASLARSRDGGRTWSEPVTVLDCPNADDSLDAV